MPRAPQKINSFVIIDFENGGLDRKDGLHAQKYGITEFAGLAMNGVTLEEIIRYDNLIKPYDPKLIYDPQAAQITGITKEMCERDGAPVKQVVDDICQLFTEANIHNSKTAKPIIVAHNWPFDRQLLQYLFYVAGVDLSKYLSGGKDAHGNFIPDGIDTIDWCKQCWAEITDTDTKYKLQACCERAGVDFVDGHRAMNDVIPTADLFRYLITRMRSGSNVTIKEGHISVHRQLFEW